MEIVERCQKAQTDLLVLIGKCELLRKRAKKLGDGIAFIIGFEIYDDDDLPSLLRDIDNLLAEPDRLYRR